MAIVETGSLVRASVQLNVTQSTVTARLKSLERDLGQALINRQKSGATLTAAGVRLLRYAQTISDLWGQARQETALPGAFDAVCNMACHPDLWPDLGEKLFTEIHQSQPSVAISLWQGGAAEITRWMASGLVDLALTYSSAAGSSQVSRPLFVDNICLFSTVADGMIKFDPGYVFVEAGEEFGRWHAAAYADAGTARLNFGLAQLGLDHILKHGGSAYLPARVAAPAVEKGTLHLLQTAPVFARSAFVVTNKAVDHTWPWLEATLSKLPTYGSDSTYHSDDR